VAELLDEVAAAPLGAVVVTAIERDGTLQGPDTVGLQSVLDLTTLPVVASGGVGSVEDLRALVTLRGPLCARLLAGVVVGKALVDGRVGLEEGMAACASSG
jgi:phosphoribosylformimino-5-aminoimidazole carboxamide ribonucleotide (ProFAR) isomerase